MNRLFDDVFRGCFERRLSSSSLSSLNGPWPERLSDSDKEIKVTAEMPGLEEKDIEVLLDDGVLTLKGENRPEVQDEDKQFSERFYGHFERHIPIGVEVERRTSRTVC